MNQKIEEIDNIMNTISYGYKDSNGYNLINDEDKWDNLFKTTYKLLTPEEVLKLKCGTCFEQVELERKLFLDRDIEVSTYFICTHAIDAIPSHTFLVYKNNNKYYWYEHAWDMYKGIHEYNSIKELLLSVKKYFINSHDYITSNDYTFVYQYDKPKYHISCDKFYEYCENSKLIKLNEPLYFYHVIDKDSDISKGILSLQYMYDNKLYELFDKNVDKYKDRITNDWNIDKYKNKKYLTREEYIDGLNIFRGDYALSYIYFFRYPLYKELGSKIEELLKYKDIYAININDEEIQKNIVDIFYGYENSLSDNKLLDKKYYEDITEYEYFKNYDDSKKINFASLNHIGIVFKDNYCPLRFINKV